MKKVKVGDKIRFKFYDGEVIDIVIEVACRCGLNENGEPNSEDDYVCTSQGFEVDYYRILEVYPGE